MPVDPHRGVHVHAVKVDADTLALEGLIDLEVLTIPSDTAELIAALGLPCRGVLLVDAVVMWQIDVLPRGIVELLAVGSACVTEVELPVLIEVLHA